MQPRPAIAILTPGILTALGLKSILEKLIPMAEVDAFDDARALEESGMERYFHFFVATRCFVGHSALFAPVRKRVILLTSGQPQPEFAGFRCLDILRPEGDLIRDIMRMHHGAHHGDHTEGIPPQPQTAQLSAREAEVLALVALPQQGDRPTAPHRPDDRHLAPPQPDREAGHPLGLGTDDLRRDDGLRRSGADLTAHRLPQPPPHK